MVRYAKPATLDEALGLMAEGPWRLLAGGTDFYPALGAAPLGEDVLDINALAGLRGIRRDGGDVVIGARTRWSDVIAAALPPAFDALGQSAREVGSIQIQNSGTVAGNLCNASPAADGVPPLLALDAVVELRSAREARSLPLSDFLLGNRRTARRPDEMMTAIRVPEASCAGQSTFIKLGARRYLVISIAMVAARIVIDDGIVGHAAIAVGSCSAVAQRLHRLEAALVGQPADLTLAGIVAAHDFAELSPLDDVRGTATYRRAAAAEIVWRALMRLIASGETGAEAA